jgi:hypothetical protein
MPDPQSNSTEEGDDWDTLVRASSNNNFNPVEAEYFEGAIAANACMQIQISMINCQKGLTELEYDQRVLVGIAGHKATLLANAKKRGMEKSNREGDKGSMAYRDENKREEERFTNGGVRLEPGSKKRENINENPTASIKK